MSYFNLNRLRHFVEVVQSGSFTAAAGKLGLGKAIVSHQVAKLEEELGVSLLVRTTRSIHLTNEGESFYKHSVAILDLAKNGADEIQRGQDEPQGRLVITAPDDYGRHVVAEVMLRMRKIYPQLYIDAFFTDEKLDLVREQIDVSVRVGWLQDSSQIAQKIGDFQQYLVAAPDYLAKLGIITNPFDLQDKDWIYNRQLSSILEWHSEKNDEAVSFKLDDPKVTVSNTETARLCALKGGGLSVLPSYQIEQDLQSGRLQHVMTDWHMPAGGIYVVYPNMSFRPAKTRLFVRELIKQQNGLMARDKWN